MACFSCDATQGEDQVADTGAETEGSLPPTFPLAPGVHDGALDSGGLERTFVIDIPSSYDGSTDLPLLLVFHGGNGSGSQLQGGLGFGAAAESDGAIVVYPDGIESNWADGRGTTDASQAGVDDVAFVSDLIHHLAAHLSIDTRRVWATGISNGGIFSHVGLRPSPTKSRRLGRSLRPFRRSTRTIARQLGRFRCWRFRELRTRS